MVISGSEDMYYITGILSSLLTNLPAESPARLRLLTKFVEGTYEKVDRLLELREDTVRRQEIVEEEIEQERKVCVKLICVEYVTETPHQNLIEEGGEVQPVQESMWFMRRVNSGLFGTQKLDYILGWLCMEDDGVCISFITLHKVSRFLQATSRSVIT